MNLLRGPARLILKLIGWKLLDLPQRPAKAVVVAYPHTSNWDFPVTLLAANVPVLLGVVDYPQREVGLLSSIALSGDEAADMARIAACYEGRKGRHPENASPIRLL